MDPVRSWARLFKFKNHLINLLNKQITMEVIPKIIIFESPTKDIATISRRFIPPDKFFDCLLRSLSKPTNETIRSISSLSLFFGKPLIFKIKI